MVHAGSLCIARFGDFSRPEFREVAALLDAESSPLEHSSHRTADLGIVAQSRPGEMADAEIDRIRRANPTMPLVVLLGNWCEGETRTGRPWPAAARVFWYEFSSWWRNNCQQLVSGQCPGWGLPLTATDEERLLAGSSAHGDWGHELIALATRRSATAEALAGACSNHGWASLWLRPGTNPLLHGVTGVVWEGVHVADEEADELRQLAAQFPGVPRVALLDFPRPESLQRARAAGATGVLAKPFAVEALIQALCPVRAPLERLRVA